MVEVELTLEEIDLTRYVAEKRHAGASLAYADPQKHGFTGSNLELHYSGCLAECAFAKSRNLYWSGGGLSWRDDDDVGGIQVRSTPLPHGSLLVRPTDGALDKPWVLLIGADGKYRLVGWLYGRETHRECWLRAPNGRPAAFFVPQSVLRPIPPLDDRI